MKRKIIDADREARLWIGQVIVPGDVFCQVLFPAFSEYYAFLRVFYILYYEKQ